MKTIILSALLLILTSCHTYIDFVYKGTEVIEYQDTIKFEPIHLHYEEIGEPKCYFIELNKIPYTQVYVIENWVVRKRRKLKSNV